jgi:hypothetical protein
MVESFASYAVQRTRDCRRSLERLPKPSRMPVKRVLTRLGKWVAENPNRVVPRGAGFVYRHTDPRVEITYCVDEKNQKLRATWVAVSLKRRLLIFISYSHKDREWVDTLQSFLTLLEDNGNVRAWEDSQIMAGQQWRVAIDEALAGASIAVLLVTQDFIASKFIRDVELPQLLEHRANGRLEVHWIPVRPCTYHDMPLNELQALCDTKKTLVGMTDVERAHEFVQIYNKLKATCERLTGAPFKSAKFRV